MTDLTDVDRGAIDRLLDLADLVGAMATWDRFSTPCTARLVFQTGEIVSMANDDFLAAVEDVIVTVADSVTPTAPIP